MRCPTMDGTLSVEEYQVLGDALHRGNQAKAADCL